MNLAGLLRRRTPDVDPEIARQVLEVLRQHSTTAEILDRSEVETVEERRRLADEIATIKAEHARQLPELQAAEAKALQAFRAARATFDAAATAWSRAQAETRGAAFNANRLADVAQRLLRAGADPRLADLRDHVSDLRDALRRTPIVNHELASKWSGGDSREERVDTNVPAIEARMRALLTVTVEIDRAELEPDQPAAVARIEALIESLPSADVMTRVTREVGLGTARI